MGERSRISVALAAATLLAVLGAISGPLVLFGGWPTGLRLPETPMMTERVWLGLAVVSLGLCCVQWLRNGRDSVAELFNPRLWTVVAVALFSLWLLSDAPLRRFGFYPNSPVLLYLLFLGAIAASLAFLRARASAGAMSFDAAFPPVLLAFAQAVIVSLFINEADGRMIFSDDHPSFLHRIQTLHDQFPRIPFYSALWEAGYSAREYFASGMLNFFFLTFPLWYVGLDPALLENAVLYNYAVLWVFVIVLPWSMFFAARLFGLSLAASTLSGLLALGPSMGYFEWLLKYGTLGFCCSMGFVPLALALSYRLAFDPRPTGFRHVLALLVVSYFVVCWSLAFFALVPIALIILCQLGRLRMSGRLKFVLLFAVLFFALNTRWILIFIEESKVLSFVQQSALPGTPLEERVGPNDSAHLETESESEDEGVSAASVPEVASEIDKLGVTAPEAAPRASSEFKSLLKKRLSHLRKSLAKINPLLWLFFLPGVLLLKARVMQAAFVGTVVWLAIVALLGEWFKPQLELKRMLVTVSFVCIIPAALALESFAQSVLRIVQTKPSRLRRVAGILGLTIVLGAIWMTPVTVAAVYSNRSDERFVFAPAFLPGLVEAIREHGGEGRTFFLGFILHDLGSSGYHQQDGGHIAPVATWSDKPLYAFHHYHRTWNTADPIPAEYRRRRNEGIEEFLDLLNVTAVVTFKREWYRYCRENPNYREVFHQGRFRVFVRRAPERGYFLEGAGRIRPRADGFIVEPASDYALLSMKFLPKLRSNYPDAVRIEPVPVFYDENERQQVEFIGLHVDRSKLDPEKPLVLGYYPED